MARKTTTKSTTVKKSKTPPKRSSRAPAKRNAVRVAKASKTSKTSKKPKTSKTSKTSRIVKKPAAAVKATPVTAKDQVRSIASRLKRAGLAFAHGTTDAVAEAAFIVSEILQRHPGDFDAFAGQRVTKAQMGAIEDIATQRIATRKPAAYLLNKIYMLGVPFYIDERAIVPRSFIGEILNEHFGEEGMLIGDAGDVSSVLDLCTGSGCLAILAAYAFPNADVDAVDLSPDALEVAKRNVRDHKLGKRMTLAQGDLFAPLKGKRYDLIISNPPYVDQAGMDGLPQECRFEPAMAFDGGADGLDIVRRILDQGADHLTPNGGLLCEIGRCRPALEAAYPRVPFLWLDTEDSEGEVFWLDAAQLRSL